MLTVIFPCAGWGSRLGLPYPKELYQPPSQGKAPKALLDYSLDHLFQTPSHLALQLVLVLRPGKEAIIDYVQKRIQHQFPLYSCWADPRYPEWCGSVYSASPYYTDHNIVLLPDTYQYGNSPLLETHLHFLERYPLAFSIYAPSDSTSLSHYGALRTEKEKILAFCDKPPLEDLHHYNACWTSYSFRKELALPLYEELAFTVNTTVLFLQTLASFKEPSSLSLAFTI
jgi:hypothetical protein